MTASEAVRDFLSRWDADMAGLKAAFEAYFTPATVWENVGLATTTGVDQALGLLSQLEHGLGVGRLTAETLFLAQTGETVLTERIDRFWSPDGRELFAVRVMGTFEMAGGRIARWRDYADPEGVAAMTGGPRRG